MKKGWLLLLPASCAPGGVWKCLCWAPFPVAGLAALIASGAALKAAEPKEDMSSTNRLAQLRAMSLSELLHTEVTTVSKRPEEMFDSPAAVYVITNDAIQRSGARSIVEALRLAPGVNVTQLTAHDWDVSIRGFGDFVASKVLVLVDGRTVYNPAFAQTFWDLQQYPLEDIERIEVVRGPGGALWGANAVNGVINIITKDAKETQGLYATAGTGTEDRAFFDTRYGGRLGPNAFYRAYITGYRRAAFPGGVDDSELIQGGLRTDWTPGDNHIMFEGDYYTARAGWRQMFPSYAAYAQYGYFPLEPYRFGSSGGNAQFRAVHQFGEGSNLSFQSYFERDVRNDYGTVVNQNIVDTELKQEFPLPGRQNAMYGLGYRYQPDNIQGGPLYFVEPESRHTQIFNVFAQDEIDLVKDRLKLTLGSKLEHNDFTGWEVEPNGRLAWLPTSRQTVWGAISRAVQVPGRRYIDYTQKGMIGFPTYNIGGIPDFFTASQPWGRDLKSEKLMAYELGYRIQPLNQLSFDLAAFYNHYDDLTSFVFPSTTFETTPFPHYLTEYRPESGGSADSRGFELSSVWRVTDSWSLSGNYSYDKVDTNGGASGGVHPQQQVSLRTGFDLPYHIHFDLWGRYVDALPEFQTSAYVTMDARLSWRPTQHLELSVVGQNLLAPQYYEFADQADVQLQLTPVPRGGYFQVTYRY